MGLWNVKQSIIKLGVMCTMAKKKKQTTFTIKYVLTIEHCSEDETNKLDDTLPTRIMSAAH